MLSQKQIQRFGSKVKIQEWERQNRLRIPFEKNLQRTLKNYFNDLAQKTVIAYETGSDVAFLNNLDNSFTRLSNILEYNIMLLQESLKILHLTEHKT